MECLEILLFHDGYTTYRVHERDEWTSTKAIELPPHGRLIDADELVGNISDTYCEECPRTKPIMCRSCEYEDIMDDIENAPVVLERTK